MRSSSTTRTEVSNSNFRGIVLYEDDRALAQQIIEAFAETGRDVVHAADADDLATMVERDDASVLIMDRMVENMDSLSLIEAFRAEGQRVPVVVISSMASVDDRIKGLKAGGDDYLVKPFAMGELFARVESLERRAADNRSISLAAGPLTMDLIARSVRRGARTLDLLPKEFSLLEYFMRHANQVVTRTMLLQDVWNYNVATQTNVVDVHVGNLRRKVDADGEDKLICSVRGVGFKLIA